MADKQRFKVTEKAGGFVAGRRNPGAGAVLDLSGEQAEMPLLLGEIVPEAAAGTGKAPKKQPASEPSNPPVAD